MKKTLFLITILASTTLYSQTITNKKGEVFDVRNVPSGSVVEYSFYQQGVFVGRSINIDGEMVFNFKNWRKLKVLINGKNQKVTKNVSNLMIKFFSQQGFSLFSTDKGQKIIPGGDNVYIRNTSSQIWIKD